MSASTLCILGAILLLGGVVYGASLLHVPHTWIGVGALVLICLAVMSAVPLEPSRGRPEAWTASLIGAFRVDLDCSRFDMRLLVQNEI